jgi:hypothetical protein
MENYTAEDFCLMVEGKFGWSVGEQARNILLEEGSLADQNENALQLIADFARSRKEQEFADEIYSYLKKLEEGQAE